MGVASELTINGARFDVSITFKNPPRIPWDYGIEFRRTDTGRSEVFIVTSERQWHRYTKDSGTDWTRLNFGGAETVINREVGQVNNLRLYTQYGRTLGVILNGISFGFLETEQPSDSDNFIAPIFGFFPHTQIGTVDFVDYVVSCARVP